MQEEEMPPGAHLFESLRAVGYELKTALADIVDNSIAAKSTKVDIFFIPTGESPSVAILDNGIGMDLAEAKSAMQLAGTSALSKREETDLGRFGLGLKTASLSQCRKLTLVTKINDQVNGLVWDLDHIAKTNKWSLIVLDQSEIDQIPFANILKSQRTGTLVVWQELDRLLPAGALSEQHADELLLDAKAHISLVFHRYLNGDPGYSRVSINLNKVEILGADPFLVNARTTQTSAVEEFSIAGEKVKVVSYTLPFLNNMTNHEKKQAQIAGSLRDSQGFYIYRQGRLVSWGTWFRLMPKNDLGKLARVRVDIPNSLDHLWSLDIKKSKAEPPAELRERLKRLAASMSGPSERVLRHRGRKTNSSDPVVHPWNVIIDRETFRYEINQEHPLINDFASTIDPQEINSFQALLRMIESCFPIQDLFVRMSEDSTPETQELEETWKQALLNLWASPAGTYSKPEEFLDRILLCEPFTALQHQRSELLELLIEAKA